MSEPAPRHDPPAPGWGPDDWGRWRRARLGYRATRRGARHGGPPRRVAGFVGCLVVGLVLFVGVLTALATWVAGALLGVVVGGAEPHPALAFAVALVLIAAVLVGGRGFGRTIGPLAELAEATERLADGEPGVRVATRGPRPVRGLAASFNAMAERLDRAREDRRALLADVTHELRTPLTVIAGSVEAMLDGVHPRDDEHLAPVLAETRVMGRLLDDLRTISLAEAGALPLHREAVDLRTLAGEVVAAHLASATAAGVALGAVVDEPVVTSVDPVRMREVLANLVTNALRHTPSGGRVTVAVGRDADDALLIVRDTGEGIPPDDLDRVFDRFHRRADTGGSGLGLTIVRDLVAAHGGSVTAHSDGVAGHGTTFRVRVPLRD